MPPLAATLSRLSATSLCKSQCTQHIIWSRNITDSAGLSYQAKIGLISARAVVLALLALISACYLLRSKLRYHCAPILEEFQGLHQLDIEELSPKNEIGFDLWQAVSTGGLKRPTSGDSLSNNVGESNILGKAEYGDFRTGRGVSRAAPRKGYLSANPCEIWKPSPYEEEISYIHNKDKGKGPEVAEPDSPTIIRCEVEGCPRTFESQNEYNHHMRYHTKPENCSHCDKSFGTTRDLRRHTKAVHPEVVPEATERYFCTVAGCKYAQEGDQQGFLRKDHWRRHMQNVHKQGNENQVDDI